jgi:uncharacterized protein (DUF983 family)
MAILKMKCPRCRKGDIFSTPTFSTKFTKMNSNCPVCGQDFEIETGFYWGSMYISYFLTVILFVIVLAGTYFAANPPTWVYLVVLCGLLLVVSPIMFRYSRVLMLYWFGFVKYDPGK